MKLFFAYKFNSDKKFIIGCSHTDIVSAMTYSKSTNKLISEEFDNQEDAVKKELTKLLNTLLPKIPKECDAIVFSSDVNLGRNGEAYVPSFFLDATIPNIFKSRVVEFYLQSGSENIINHAKEEFEKAKHIGVSSVKLNIKGEENPVEVYQQSKMSLDSDTKSIDKETNTLIQNIYKWAGGFFTSSTSDDAPDTPLVPQKKRKHDDSDGDDMTKSRKVDI